MSRPEGSDKPFGSSTEYTGTDHDVEHSVQRPPNLVISPNRVGPGAQPIGQTIPLMPYQSGNSKPYSPLFNAHRDDASFHSLERAQSVRSLFSRHSEKQPTDEAHLENPYSNSLSNEEPDVVEEHKLLKKIEEESSESDEDELPDIAQVVNELHEENLVPQDSEGPKRRRGYHKKLQRSGSEQRPYTKRKDGKIVTGLRNMYNKILSRTLLTRSLVYWFPLAAILFVPLAVGAWGNPAASVGHRRIMWLFIWLEVVWGSLWISRIFAHYLPAIAQIFLGIINPTWRKYTSVLVAMEMSITYVLWTFVSFITFMPLLSENHHILKDAKVTQKWQYTVNNIMVSFFLSSLVYAAERLLIHFISVSFHKTRFATRIKENKQAIRVLVLLLDASYSIFPRHCPEFDEEDTVLETGGLLIQGSSKRPAFVQHVASSHNAQKIAGTVNKVVGGAAAAIGNVAKDIRGDTSCNIPAYGIVIGALSKKALAEILASRIWKSLVLEDAEELRLEDLQEVLGEVYKADAEKLFGILDKDTNGGIILDEMVISVQDISQEQKSIYRSLRDMDSAIGKLHAVLLFVVVLIMILIFIGLLAPSVSAVLATLGTSLLALSFVFSATAQEILASCVFLFVKHPLDIGDLVSISMPNGVTNMICTEISLLYTVFRDQGTGVLRQASNALLNSLWIDNISRSGPMSAAFSLVLGVPETSYEDIEVFRERLDRFIAQNIRDYCPGPYVELTDMPDLDKVKLTISVTYRHNFADGTLLGVRRTRFLKFLSECVHDIPLHLPRRDETYSNPAVPMYSAALPADVVEKNLANAKARPGRAEHNGRLPIGMETPYESKELEVEEGEDAALDETTEVDSPTAEADRSRNRPVRSLSIASRVTSMSRHQSRRGLRKH